MTTQPGKRLPCYQPLSPKSSIVRRVESALSAGSHASTPQTLGRLYLATYKVPGALQFVCNLPKTITSNVIPRELKTLDKRD